VVGDLLIDKVTKVIPNSRGYAVQYPASLNMAVSAPSGIVDTINRLNKQHELCPKQKFALVGYSQGAGVMHGVFGPPVTYAGGPKEAPKLNPNVIPNILALVMFGDPAYKGGSGPLGALSGGAKFPGLLHDRLRENCAPRDPVCDPNAGGFEQHLEYVKNPWQSESAAYIIDAFKGLPLPRTPRSAEEAKGKVP
jgi:cutinase